MPEGRAVRSVKVSSITTGGQKLCVRDGDKLYCESKAMGVTQHTVHDAKTGRINLTTNAFHPRSSVVGDVLTCICVDPGQEKGYVGYLSGRMTVFSADTSTDVSWPAHKSKVTQLLFLPSDKPGGKANLWSSSTDGFIKLWDGTRAAAKGSGHRGDILDMVYVPFAAGGGVIWTGGADKSIRVWDRTGTAAAGTGSARRQTQLRCLESVCGLIPDEEQQVVWSCDKANLRAWSADTRNCVWTGMRGGVAFALCGQYVVALIDGGASIGVWDRTLDLETETEIPPRTVFAVPDKGISKMLTFTPDSLLLPAAHGLTIIQLEEYAVDASVEIVIEKAIDESVGAIFRADKNLVLERVEPGSAAERCGGVRFLGRTLTHVNGTPVQTVGDVRASVRRQTSFSMKFAPGGNQQNGSAPVHLAVTPAIRRVPSINVTGMNGAAASHTNSNTNSNNLAAPAQPLQKKLSGLGFPSRRDHAPLPDRALTDKHAQPKNSKKKLERRGSNPVLISPAHKDFIQLDDIPPRSPTRKDVKKSSKTQISPGQREVLETVRSITAATETTTDSELASLLKAYVDKLHDDKKKLERDVKDAQSAASDAGESCKELERTKREAKGKLDELEKTVQECKADTLKYKGQLHKVQQTKEQLTQQLTEKEKAIRSFESRLQNNDTLGQSLRETLQRTLNPQLQEIIRSLEGIKRVNDYIEPTVTEISRSVKASSLHGSKGDIRLDLVSPLKKPAKSKTTSPHIGPKSMHSKEFPRINDASARSGSPSTTSAAAGVDQLLVRCCDALQTVFTDLGFTSPASLLPGCAEARAELLLMRLKALHAEICARQDFSPSSEPITHPFQASTGSMLDRAAPMSSARTDMSPASNQASFPPVKVPNSASKRRGYTITSHIRSSTDYSGFSSSGSDVRQANQPGAHGPAPSAFDDDQVIGKNGRLFDKRNKLQRWLLWKPDQLQSRAAQCKRDAKERGVKAVDIALQQYEEYQAKERLEYEAIWAELQTALADSPAPLEPFTAAWAKLGQAEESFKQLLDKLHEQYADAKVVSASISPKCDELSSVRAESSCSFSRQTFRLAPSSKKPHAPSTS
ncbi:hypothetical protein DIPPA_18568 [Diplonema papillatum]|nr:hypothetical protein DIPPA_18568 [Diplonema papillatum]